MHTRNTSIDVSARLEAQALIRFAAQHQVGGTRAMPWTRLSGVFFRKLGIVIGFKRTAGSIATFVRVRRPLRAHGACRQALHHGPSGSLTTVCKYCKCRPLTLPDIMTY
jgi:hypothetical protein